MASSTNPLNDDHLTQLNHLLKATAETGDYLTKCENCGIDVELEKQKNAQQQEVARRIKATFFPHQV